MKRFASILITTGMICLSPLSIAQSGSESSTQPTSTKPNVVRAAKVPKLKLFRSNPHRYHKIYVENNDEVTVNDEDLMSPYRKEDLFKIVNLDSDLDEDIRWRLFLARQLAVLKLTQQQVI